MGDLRALLTACGGGIGRIGAESLAAPAQRPAGPRGGSDEIWNERVRLALGLAAAPALAQDTVKIGYIDPLSGGGGSVGEGGLKTYNYLADEINAAGGVNGKKLEIVPFDNKGNPQETLIQAQKAADQGIRIVVQGNGSSNGIALSDWVTKFDQRNPGKEIIYLNYGAIDRS